MEINVGDLRTLGVEIRGLDLRTADAAAVRAVLDTVHQHALVRLKNQRMTVQEYLQFGLKLGTLMPYPDTRCQHPEYPAVSVSSNVRQRNLGMTRSGNFWHTDLSFLPRPQPLTVLYPQLLPEARRETLFVNMANIYDTMPPHLRAMVQGRSAKHDPVLRYMVSQADVDASLSLGELMERGRRELPAATHPCVITHPVNKQRILYMNEGFTTSIDGISHELGQAALKELFAFIKQPEHIQTHSWELGDVIVWDNRMLIHSAGCMAAGDYQTIYRLGIDDGVPFYDGIFDQLNRAVQQKEPFYGA
jgi:taurine dioxygenase